MDFFFAKLCLSSAPYLFNLRLWFFCCPLCWDFVEKFPSVSAFSSSLGVLYDSIFIALLGYQVNLFPELLMISQRLAIYIFNGCKSSLK